MTSDLRSTYIRLCGLLMVLLVLVKFGTVMMGGELLNRTDQLLGLQFRTVMLGTGACEFGTALVCLLRPRGWLAPLVLTTLGAEFLLYRISSKMLGVQKMCPCLGYFTQWLGLDQRATDWLLGGTSLFLFFGGIWFLLKDAQREE